MFAVAKSYGHGMIARAIALIAFVPGCYIEARADADLLAASGNALGGTQVDGAFVAGVELDVGDHVHAIAGGAIDERLLAHSRATTTADVTAPGIELGFVNRSVPDALRSASAYDIMFDLTSFMPPKSTNVSELRTVLAARFEGGPIALRVGPSISWWDAAKNGAAVGAGVEAAVRVVVDPRPR